VEEQLEKCYFKQMKTGYPGTYCKKSTYGVSRVRPYLKQDYGTKFSKIA